MTISLHSAADINRYAKWMTARKLSPGSVRTAKYVLNGLGRRLGTARILEATRDDLTAWQLARADDLAPGTLITHIAVLRGYYRWAMKDGLIESDPSDVLEAPKAPRRLPRPIAEQDLADALGRANEHVRAILALAAFAGLRSCEIAGLDWSEVKLVGRAPIVRVVGKGSHERIVDVSPPLATALGALPGRRRGPVIPRLDGRAGHNTPNRLSQIANEYLDAAGIDATLHQLRHRFGTRVYQVSRDIRATQEALGHANPTTTAIYARVARGSVRDAILAAGEVELDEVAER